MNYYSGFVLGLGTGVVCLAYCGPVLIPFLMGEGRTVPGNFRSIILFLLGRLIAYLIIGLASGILGSFLLQQFSGKPVFFGILYILLSMLLILYGFHHFKEICLGRRPAVFKKSKASRWPILVPVLGGFATGLNICPPFLLAITNAAETGNVFDSMIFFFMFFMGTVLYFIPLPFIGFFHRQHVLRIIGKFASILAGVIYLIKGINMVL